MKLLDKLYDTFTKWLTRERPPRDVPLSDFERICYEIRPADVLLVEGRSRVTDVIKMVTQSPWSHSCLYIGKLHDIADDQLRAKVAAHYKGDPNEPLIIHSLLGKGTIVSALSMYRDEHMRICRPKGIARSDAIKVITYAIHRLGKDYDVRHILDLARFLYPWSLLPKRWRSSLFHARPDDTTRAICSTLIAEAFNSVQFPILPIVTKHKEKGIELIPRNPRLYTPGDFDYSPYFEIIKYPFLEISHAATYRQLPWSDEQVVSDDKGVLTENRPSGESSTNNNDDVSNNTN